MSTTDEPTDANGRRVMPDDDPAASTKDPSATPKAAKAASSRSSAKGAGSKDPEQLAADIEKTREELAETLDAIAEKVSPKRVAKRTTKKVTDAVKDTASSAKEKVSGATSGRGDTSWAPDPGAVSHAAVPELPPTAPVEVPTLQTTTYAPPQVTSGPGGAMSTYTTSGSLIKPEYIAAGVVAGLIAWFIVRKRRG